MPLRAVERPGGQGRQGAGRTASPAANTALPFVNQDPSSSASRRSSCATGQVTVDVFGLVRGGRRGGAGADPARRRGRARAWPARFAQGEEAGQPRSRRRRSCRRRAEVLAPLDKVDARVRRGESVRVEVVVRTRKVGHFFPGGTVDAFDVWVELEAVDEKGRTLFHSGAVEDGGKGPVEPGAHFYRSLLLDEHGNPINKRNAWMARSVAYVRLIPPGAADTIHYRLRIPEDCGRPHHAARRKVNYRKFAWWNTQWAFAGVRDPGHQGYSLGARATTTAAGCSPATPPACLGRDQGDPATSRSPSWPRPRPTLEVLPAGAPLPDDAPAARQVGARALERLRHRPAPAGRHQGRGGGVPEGHARWSPDYADGWVNVARARIQEGNMAGAQRGAGARRSSIDPELAKTHFFLGIGPEGARPLRRGARPPARRARAQYPRRPRGAEPDRPRAVPAAPVPGGRRRAAGGAGHRPRGPAGPLQPDALLPGAGRPGAGASTSRRSTSASRPTRPRRPSPAPTASSIPHDNNERQSDPRAPRRAAARRAGGAAYPRRACAGTVAVDKRRSR